MRRYPVQILGADGQPAPHAAADSTLQGPPAVRAAERRSLTTLIDTRAARGLASIFALLPDPDEILLREGDGIYDRMRDDDAVFAAEFQLMTRILGRPWDVRPAEHLAGDAFAIEVAAYAKGVLAAMNTDAMLEHLTRALRHRHAGGQLVYRQDGAAYVPALFVPERRGIFRFGARGELLVNLTGIPEAAEPFKWAHHVNEPEPERPAGRSIFSRVYYPWRFKRTGWDLWVTAMDRFAVPSLAALFELAETDADKAAEIVELLNEQLVKIASGSVGSLSNVTSLQVIGGAKAVEGFDVFCEMCDRSIYRGILTTTLTVSEGKEGAERGNTLVADAAADQVAYHYGRQIAASVTRGVVAYAALLKFGEAARAALPRFEFDFEEPISHERLLGFIDRGVPTSLGAMYSRHGVPKPVDEKDTFVRPGLGEAAAPAATGTRRQPGAAAASGPGATATLEYPEADAPEIGRRLYTYRRDRAISERFQALRASGATWDEALGVLEEEQEGLSRARLKNIVLEGRRAQLSNAESE